ncbi:hypothetical protein BV378_25330 [Nostoc sp. RF31YmG]|nr:hypothetical protein BV378_25330 [Nostoc sp. RF31YmG]
MGKKLNQLAPVSWMIGVSALILFACSSLRHELFQSGAWDLGFFDQAVYLISQGKPPISSFVGFHVLADHAAWILYPLALLYKIYPTVYWLFAVQAIALPLGTLPTWYLARQAGLKESQAIAVATAYLLYPVIFNINLFDFHPDVIAVPALLAAVLAARGGNIWLFCGSILIILGCKAVFSLSVAAMGIWLLIFEKRRLCGAIAILSGLAWFAIATKGIIPYFGGSAASVERHIYRYSYLGKSFPEMAQTFLFKPGIVLENLLSFDNLSYLILLFLPVIWGLSLPAMTPLVAAIPPLAINLIADYQHQKDLVFQYSLPILPFLLLAVIKSLAAGKGLLQNKRAIILWSLIAFLSLGKYGFFWTKYLSYLDTWQATRDAIAQIQTTGSIYTTDIIAPHVTHRQTIKLIDANSPIKDLTEFDYILLNVRHTGLWSYQPEFSASLVQQLKNRSEFKLSYQRDDVYLFIKN